jgi:diguanylate cyclase (GGDEF)-like protein
MSRSATGDAAAPSTESQCPRPARLPEAFWPVVVEHLVDGQDYLIVLSRRDLRIEYANDAFDQAISACWKVRPQPFLETVVPALEATLKTRFAEDRDQVELEVHHEIPCGARPVLYTFRAHGDKWIGFGRDQSVQLELVSQLATLVSDLELRVDYEKERSETLKRLSEKDSLTGLANRRVFEMVYRSHLRAFRDKGAIFSILCIDIDGFKNVNDRFGHPMGDEVLRRVASILEAKIREGDCVARMGGDELVLLARGTELAAAADLAERLRQSIARAPMPPPLTGVTVSIGVACVTQVAQYPDDSADDLLALGDRALYEAKRAGRDAVRWNGFEGK